MSLENSFEWVEFRSILEGYNEPKLVELARYYLLSGKPTATEAMEMLGLSRRRYVKLVKMLKEVLYG